MKFRYTGKEPQNLAQVGLVKEGDVIEVSDAIGASLLKNAPEQFEVVKKKKGDEPAPAAGDGAPGEA